MTALLLDGQKVRGKNLKVTANLRIETEDLSGQTSNTSGAHKGFKPKTLTVTLMIPFRDRADLVALVALAEATAGGGQRKTYRVVNDTAEAFGVRQVEFADNFSSREDDVLRAWQIQFGLSEKLSTAEKVETRRPGNAVKAQGGTGQAVGGDAAGSDGSAQPAGLSGFEKVLKRLDDALA
ncbi:DNA-binding protein [Pseudomonas syringae]|uniref:baseplate complex protein n=1 Tax=Pseudomonas syringae TaxID=317 RepID=UPI001F2CF8BF|nr:DNA-binding protein [Pseudomonas syringae]MCF5721038.1 DNA-binding protein [Pseudomonas syringae]